MSLCGCVCMFVWVCMCICFTVYVSLFGCVCVSVCLFECIFVSFVRNNGLLSKVYNFSFDRLENLRESWKIISTESISRIYQICRIDLRSFYKILNL